MSNTPENIQPNTTEFKQYKANLASAALLNQIGQIDEKQINSETAVVALGLLLTRDVEFRYLESFMGARPDTDTPPAQVAREEAGKLQGILIDAQNGDFKGLKKFGEERAVDWKSIAQTDSLEGSEEYEKDMNIGRNLDLLAAALPESGDGNLIAPLLPAWMEEPRPLTQYLKIQGGDN